MLNHTTYEIIRWVIAILLPALGLLLVNINNAWNLGLPADEISTTLDALGLFLGTVFGVSKIVNDKELKAGQKKKKNVK